MTNIQRCLAQNMKFHRKKLGMSQVALAEKAGTAPNYIALIEVGKSFPSLQMLEKISKALEIDALDLFDKSCITEINRKNLMNDLIISVTEAITKTLSSHTMIKKESQE